MGAVRTRPSLRSATATASLVLGWALVARADGPILHEYVPGVADEGMSLVSSGGEEPAALVYHGEVIEPPSGGALRGDERAMHAAPGDGAATEEPGRRSPVFRPDRVTSLEGEIRYFEVFTPTITPFKRVTALDGVTLDGNTPVLSLADRGPATRVEVEGAQAPSPDGRPRDRFWGSVVLDFRGGRVVPFPSVSPESRILTLRTEPPTELHLERDGAANFLAVLDRAPEGAELDGTPAGAVRVVFLTDAPRTYFGTAIPERARADALISEVPVLPARLERRALDFAASRLAVRRDTPFHVALDRLVEHFRSFEESREPPTDTGDVYWDLATGMRGICRHRAYAFVLTAQALGMMARFVQNEAHAWVEVHLPENRGWLRIDLGGAAGALAPQRTEGRPAYQPSVPDPLPRPEPYVRAQTQQRRTSEAPPEGPSSAGAAAPGDGAEGPEGTTGSEGTATSEGESDASSGPPSSFASAPAAGPHRAPRGPLELRLDTMETTRVLRGRELHVTGTARSDDVGVEGLRIEILLAPERGDGERLLGVTVSGPHGLFQTGVAVPPDVAVGDYTLVVRSPGDARVLPATAR